MYIQIEKLELFYLELKLQLLGMEIRIQLLLDKMIYIINKK